jgi:hypothetical protein
MILFDACTPDIPETQKGCYKNIYTVSKVDHTAIRFVYVDNAQSNISFVEEKKC